MKTNIDCSIIILSYNTKDVTDECLRCIKKSTEFARKHKKSIEIIVIDNASRDGSVEMIRKKHSWVKLIASKENTGFSRGNNIGMQMSSGKYILLLNSDAFIKENTLFQSIEFFENYKECDVMGCQLRFINGQLQPSAGYLPEPINTSLWITGLSNLPGLSGVRPIHPKSNSFFSQIRKVEWVTGAFFMIKRSVYEETGGFDENLFMYGEEVEWCKRINDKGFHIWYVPKIVVKHIHKASSKDFQERPFVSEIKSFVYFFRKYYSSFYPITKIIMAIGLVFRAFGFAVLMKPTRSSAYIKSLSLL